MGDSLRYKDWFEKAIQDLRGAEILMEHDGGNDFYKGFSWEDDGPLGNGVNITCKTEVPQIVQEVLLKDPQAAQISDIAFIKMQVSDIFDHLLKACTDGKPVAMGIGTVEHVKDNGLVGVLFLKIALHHSQLIQVCK